MECKIFLTSNQIDMKYTCRAMSDLTYCIKLFYNAFVSGVQPLNTYEKHKFMLMTNYQSKFLGYSGIINDTKTAKQALEYLRTQIHVVGLTGERMENANV